MKRTLTIGLLGLVWTVAAHAEEPREAPLPARVAFRGPGDMTRETRAPAVRSTLPRRVIERVMRANQASALSCYEYALRIKPDAEGSATVAIDVDAAGRVANARVVESADRRFGGCVERIVRGWQFPTNGPATAVLTFNFAASTHE